MESRSRSTKPPPWRTSSACRRETLVSARTTSQSRLRPSTMARRSMAKRPPGQVSAHSSRTRSRAPASCCGRASARSSLRRGGLSLGRSPGWGRAAAADRGGSGGIGSGTGRRTRPAGPGGTTRRAATRRDSGASGAASASSGPTSTRHGSTASGLVVAATDLGRPGRPGSSGVLDGAGRLGVAAATSAGTAAARPPARIGGMRRTRPAARPELAGLARVSDRRRGLLQATEQRAPTRSRRSRARGCGRARCSPRGGRARSRKRRLVGRELLAVGRRQVEGVDVGDVDLRHRDGAVVVHLLGQLAGQLDGLHVRPEGPSDAALEDAFEADSMRRRKPMVRSSR